MATTTKSKKKKERAVKTNVLNVAYIWDMSYSMSIVRDATMEGTGTYLTDLQAEEAKLVKDEGEGIYTRVSLTVFDTVFEPWLVDEPILGVQIGEVVGKYWPRGNTALYDAIGHTVVTLDKRMTEEGRQDEKVLVIVMTDGEENSSREFSRQRIFDLIHSYEAKGNWTFVYLGANVDAYAEAGAMGIARGNTVSYSSTPGSIAGAMGATGAPGAVGKASSYLRTSGAGSTATAFADAGLGTDYRDEDDKKLWTPNAGGKASAPLWTPEQSGFADSSKAKSKSRKMR